MKQFFVACLVLLISGCGANVHKTTGVANEQNIIIVADSLVGKTISVGNVNGYVITDADLTPYQTGVAGVTDSELEQSEVLKIKVNEGMNNLVLKSNGVVIFSKELYLSAGQTRTIKL